MRPWKLWPLAVVLATGCAIASGCSGFSGDDGPAAPPAEASTDAPASPDADAGIAADASTRFCMTGDATAALFCSDFDEGSLTHEWQVPTTSGGRFEATPSDRSPPNALLTIVDTFPPIVPHDAANPSPSDGDGGLGYSLASVTTTFGRGAATGVSIELDMRIDELPTNDGGFVGVTFLTAAFDSDDRSVALSYVQGGGFYFVVKDPGMKQAGLFPVNPPSTPRWFHVELRTAFDGSFASLSFDGIQVALSPRGVMSSAIGIVLVVGSVATATTGMARAAYDNVIVHPL